MSEFTVTRQHRWPDGEFIVEVSQGSLDYANPGMLCAKWEGEGETFQGLTPAVSAAIAIAKAWQASTPQEEIKIAVGATHGMTAHFDDEPATEETFSALLDEATAYDEKLPKCPQCGDLLGKERWGPHWMHQDERDCCSEYCAETYYADPEEEEDDDE